MGAAWEDDMAAEDGGRRCVDAEVRRRRGRASSRRREGEAVALEAEEAGAGGERGRRRSWRRSGDAGSGSAAAGAGGGGGEAANPSRHSPEDKRVEGETVAGVAGLEFPFFSVLFVCNPGGWHLSVNRRNDMSIDRYPFVSLCGIAGITQN